MNKIVLLLIFGMIIFAGCLEQSTTTNGSGSAVSTNNNDNSSVQISTGGSVAPANPTVTTTTTQAADKITIQLSDVSSTVKYYTYNSGGVAIKYFAVKGSDDKVRIAFDACEVCYRAKKGYTQVGDSVKCNNCGLQFKIDDLGTKNKGSGCWPAYLPNEVQGDKIVIKKIDLEKGKYLFS
ncbi:MAG: DUF2318 domain-containing protein [Candidatus Micrarchaeota archaeon]